jgi:hypothetical protein
VEVHVVPCSQEEQEDREDRDKHRKVGKIRKLMHRKIGKIRKQFLICGPFLLIFCGLSLPSDLVIFL